LTSPTSKRPKSKWKPKKPPLPPPVKEVEVEEEEAPKKKKSPRWPLTPWPKKPNMKNWPKRKNWTEKSWKNSTTERRSNK